MAANQAGWRIANDLRVPDNMLACSPELNPVERRWLCLKERFPSHRLLDDYETIVDVACAGRIKSLCSYPWINASQQSLESSSRTTPADRFRIGALSPCASFKAVKAPPLGC